MMITRRDQVPWSWVLFASFPFAIMIFAGAIPGMGFTFTLKKFVDNPALITFVLSIGLPVMMVVGPTVNYLSDRLWTRFGRRKIFMVASALVTAASILSMPFAPNLPVLIGCLILFNFGCALNTTTQPLSNEIIPIPQRGRASSLQYIILTVGNIVFYTFLIGRFDDVRFMGPLTRLLNPLTGEVLLYAVYAIIVLTLMLMTALGIKEMLPPRRATMDEVRVNGRFSLRKYLRFFFVDVFDRQWVALYMLLFANAMYSLGLGAMTPLLYTEQWGYSKQAMGMNVAIGAVILIPFAAVAGWFLDKFSKMKLYQICILLVCLIKVVYWVFVEFILPDHRPALWQIILFGELMAIVGTLSGVAMMPLYYEYVPRNKMGTAAAGMSLMSNLFGFLAANLTGLWVTGYSHLFCPHAGYEVRAVLEQPADRATLQQVLQQGDPNLPAQGFYAEPLFPPGQGGAVGRHWMIRFEDQEAARREAIRKQTEQQRLDLERRRDEQRARGLDPANLERELEALQATIRTIEAEHAAASAHWQQRVTRALAATLTDETQGLRAITNGFSTWLEIPTTRSMNKQDVDRLEARVRLHRTDLIQIMPLRSLQPEGRRQGIACLMESTPGQAVDATALLDLIQAEITASPRRLAAGLAPLQAVTPAEVVVQSGPLLWKMDVGLVEALGPASEEELAKALRIPAQRAARVDAREGMGAQIRVAEFGPASPDGEAVQPAVERRLREAGLAEAGVAGRLTEVYEQLIRSCDGLRLTVERPVTGAHYAPQRYNYFSGYILMFLTDILALYITVVIIRLERKGVVRKLGVEEHQHKP
jgi:MFS family permease